MLDDITFLAIITPILVLVFSFIINPPMVIGWFIKAIKAISQFFVNAIKGVFQFFEAIPEEAQKAPLLVLIIFLLIIWIIYFEEPKSKLLQDNFLQYSQELEMELENIPEAIAIKQKYDDEYLKGLLLR